MLQAGFFGTALYLKTHDVQRPNTATRPASSGAEGWTPRQGRPRVTLAPWIPHAQLVPLGDGALSASPVHQSEAGEEVRQAGGLRSLFEQVKWRRPGGRAYRNSVIEASRKICIDPHFFAESAVANSIIDRDGLAAPLHAALCPAYGAGPSPSSRPPRPA